MTVRVELSNFADTLEEFAHLRLDEIRQGVVSGLARAIPEVLVPASPVDTGLYAQSWMFTSDEEHALLGNTAPHAPIIELGARPFTPPIKPLLEWAKRVLSDPSQPPNYSPRVWALAKYTQNKIAENGMQPRHILQDSLPAIINLIREELSRL